MSSALEVRRLTVDDIALARQTFTLVADVFEEPGGPLSDDYLTTVLGRPGFWALVAMLDGEPVGGVTAHALPMTRHEAYELFIYDIAVHAAHQRRGIGRALIDALRSRAAAEGMTVAFVPADNEDEHALDFYRALGGEPASVTIFTFE